MFVAPSNQRCVSVRQDCRAMTASASHCGMSCGIYWRAKDDLSVRDFLSCHVGYYAAFPDKDAPGCKYRSARNSALRCGLLCGPNGGLVASATVAWPAHEQSYDLHPAPPPGLSWQCACGAYNALGRYVCSCGKQFAGPLQTGYVRTAVRHGI